MTATNNESESRDHFLDIARGLCIFSVVFIHTCFWSGSSYVPTWMQSLSLLVDVPLFFFISGCTTSMKSIQSPLNAIFRIVVCFASFGLLYDLLTFDFSFPNVIRALTLNSPEAPLFPVVRGSFWFFPVFIAVIIFGAILQNFAKYLAIPAILGGLLYYLFTYQYLPRTDLQILGTSLNTMLFYFAVYLLGAVFYRHILPKKTSRYTFGFSLIVFALLGSGFLVVRDHSIYILQNYKFPVQLPYVISSCLSVGAISLIWRRSLRLSFLEHVGKNALYYFIGQGIGASLLYRISGELNMHWYIKLPMMFILNAIASILFAQILILFGVALHSLTNFLHLKITVKASK